MLHIFAEFPGRSRLVPYFLEAPGDDFASVEAILVNADTIAIG